MLALRHGTALFVDVLQRAFWESTVLVGTGDHGEPLSRETGYRSEMLLPLGDRGHRGLGQVLLTCMLAVANPVAANTRFTGPLFAVYYHLGRVYLCKRYDKFFGFRMAQRDVVSSQAREAMQAYPVSRESQIAMMSIEWSSGMTPAAFHTDRRLMMSEDGCVEVDFQEVGNGPKKK